VVVILRKLKNSDIVKAAAAVEEGVMRSSSCPDKLTGVNVKCLHENFGRPNTFTCKTYR
jgi:hypothetical protein